VLKRSAHLESKPAKRRAKRAGGGLVKLSEAALALGFHVETLRLRVRQGELTAIRGAHGAYYLTRATMAAIKPPRRSARRAFAPESLEPSWYLLAKLAEKEGASASQLRVIGVVKRNPALARPLHHLLTVKRLRLAGLTSAEIADLTGLSKRHVRRLTRRSLTDSLEAKPDDPDVFHEEERDGDDLESLLHARAERRAKRLARQIVKDIQRRVREAGFQYHHRPKQPRDVFIPKIPAPAFKVKARAREVIRHLKDAGLSDRQIKAINVAGIGQDELNELILNGLPPDPK
jgi:AraC-like DNA-binding protein